MATMTNNLSENSLLRRKSKETWMSSRPYSIERKKFHCGKRGERWFEMTSNWLSNLNLIHNLIVSVMIQAQLITDEFVDPKILADLLAEETIDYKRQKVVIM